jgi:hypothetical protein
MKHLTGYLSFLNESEEDKGLRDLLKDMQGLGLTLTEEEEDMLEFVNHFGGDKSPGEYAEYLYDYYTYPGNYDIDPEGDYYDMIWYLYENSVQGHARHYLSGPMRGGNYQTWDESKIANEPLYKMYVKMSGHYNKIKSK